LKTSEREGWFDLLRVEVWRGIDEVTTLKSALALLGMICRDLERDEGILR
jgi:hypothetical protein